jgi:putative Ca2+/H+ antiporter (TMEM165/GDT1 family)
VVDVETPQPEAPGPHVDKEAESTVTDGREPTRRQDGQRRPDPGYRAPSLVAGRPSGIFLHSLALVLAAVADLGAFAQVVELVMANQPAVISYLVVGGLTATVLYLAHSVGIMVRDRVAKKGPARKTWVLLATLGWAAIGGVACWVRLLVTDEDVQAPSVSLSSDPTAPVATNPTALPAAILFLALFIGSGLVAAIGAYLTHNPLAGEYRVTRTRYQSAARRAGETAGVRTAVERRLRHLRVALVKARRLRDRERGRRRHFAEELKQHARLLMANHVQDPAFSDALFDPDRLPYSTSRNGNGTKSSASGGASPGD